METAGFLRDDGCSVAPQGRTQCQRLTLAQLLFFSAKEGAHLANITKNYKMLSIS
jgi:hypothetical protein